MSWFFKTADHSKIYRQYRPTYPSNVYDFIYSQLPQDGQTEGRWELAVDVGCGTGVHTFPFSDRFRRVIGVDSSDFQLDEARQFVAENDRLKNCEFVASPADDLSFLQDSSVDLVTAAQAVHYFNEEKFFKESWRVLKNNGLLVVLAYRQDIGCPKREEIMIKVSTIEIVVLAERGHKMKIPKM